MEGSGINVKELIGEVAKRHNVLLGPDDPILVTLTLNELVVGHLVQRIEGAVNGALDQLSGAQAQHIETSREVASDIITRAATYSADQLHKAASDLVASLRSGTQADVIAAQEAARQAKQFRAQAIYAAIGAGLLVVLALGLILGRII